ncbi:MAG: UDP-3-O-(3-hydroxymyristoyl)glucosamine N-acyltransferase [Gemmatimonadaceae bacterium]|nr:UDP-3-O-(3-hydroxymyristoyl)glucosamine N-acyltransferase [Gemmatimonadaceae bacterium]
MTDGSAQPGAGGAEQQALTAGAVAREVGGELRGNPDLVVSAIAPLDRAGPDDVAFLALARYAALAATTRAGVLLVSPDLADIPTTAGARVVVDRPHEAVLGLLPRFYRAMAATPGVHPSATIGRGATLGARVSVGANVVLGDGVTLGDDVVVEPNVTIGAGVTLGAGCRIFANATLYSGVALGKRVFIHSGVRLGSDGFGYVFRGGVHEKIPHVGRCLVGDDVEIGANTTVDRGSIDDTVIGAGTKIDNLVQIGHNVRVGRLCLIMSQVGISGSARIEDGAIVAGQAGLAGHIVVGTGARIGGQSGVFGDVPAGQTWSGYPARPHRESLRAQAAVHKLPSLLRRLERLLLSESGEGK